MIVCFGITSARSAFVSASRNLSSPYFAKISGIDTPNFEAAISSVSSRAKPVLCWRQRPTADLPAPIVPISTIDRSSRFIGAISHQRVASASLPMGHWLEANATWRLTETPYNSPMSESKFLVAVIMGSKSDWDTMRNAVETLDELGVPNEARVLSAHRTPDATAEFARSAADRGLRVIIAGAGGAAHLAGVIAAHTWLPVLGVPIQSKLQGLDSLLSTAQMPGGIPVGTLAIGEAGAKNAALLAAAILATSNDMIREKLEGFRRKQSEAVLAAKLSK